MWYMRWQNRTDDLYFLSSTSLFSISIMLRGLSKVVIFIHSPILLTACGLFDHIDTKHSKTCFQSSTNALVWSWEHEPTAPILPQILIAGPVATRAYNIGPVLAHVLGPAIRNKASSFSLSNSLQTRCTIHTVTTHDAERTPAIKTSKTEKLHQPEICFADYSFLC